MEQPERESIERALGSMSSADKMVLSRLNENGMAWIVGGWVRDSLSGGAPRFLHFTLERSTLLFFFFFQRIVTQRKLSIIARVVPFLLPFSFLEQTRFRFLEQTT